MAPERQSTALDSDAPASQRQPTSDGNSRSMDRRLSFLEEIGVNYALTETKLRDEADGYKSKTDDILKGVRTIQREMKNDQQTLRELEAKLGKADEAERKQANELAAMTGRCKDLEAAAKDQAQDGLRVRELEMQCEQLKQELVSEKAKAYEYKEALETVKKAVGLLRIGGT